MAAYKGQRILVHVINDFITGRASVNEQVKCSENRDEVHNKGIAVGDNRVGESKPHNRPGTCA